MTRYLALSFENERPLHGLAGWLDWTTHGEVSRFVRAGVLTGAEGEIVLIPYRRRSLSIEILLVGMGRIQMPGSRKEITFPPLPKNNPLSRLAWNQVTLSTLEADALKSWTSKGDIECQLIDV